MIEVPSQIQQELKHVLCARLAHTPTPLPALSAKHVLLVQFLVHYTNQEMFMGHLSAYLVLMEHMLPILGPAYPALVVAMLTPQGRILVLCASLEHFKMLQVQHFVLTALLELIQPKMQRNVLHVSKEHFLMCLIRRTRAHHAHLEHTRM